MTDLTDIISRLEKLAEAEATERRLVTIYVYHKEARGFASRALRKVLPKKLYGYKSRSALVQEGMNRSYATPRYLGEATDEEFAKILEILDSEDAYGVDMYHD